MKSGFQSLATKPFSTTASGNDSTSEDLSAFEAGLPDGAVGFRDGPGGLFPAAAAADEEDRGRVNKHPAGAAGPPPWL